MSLFWKSVRITIANAYEHEFQAEMLKLHLYFHNVIICYPLETLRLFNFTNLIHKWLEVGTQAAYCIDFLTSLQC